MSRAEDAFPCFAYPDAHGGCRKAWGRRSWKQGPIIPEKEILVPGCTLMRFPESASLGLHAMACLARSSHENVSSQAIADMLQGSKHHLAKVLQRLARAGLVRSDTGPGGGFRLAKRAEQITLLDICEATDGPLDAPGCLLESQVCDGVKGCLLGAMIQSVSRQMREFLHSTTLADLAGSVTICGKFDGGAPQQPASNSSAPREQRPES